MTISIQQTIEVPVYSKVEVDALASPMQADIADLRARVAALEAGGAVHLAPVPYPLFGPVQGEGAFIQVVTPAWQFPGSALTPSTERFYFDMGLPQARKVRWQVSWAAGSVNLTIRLVHMDDGPNNITEIARIQGTGSGQPTGAAVDVTTEFNALVSAGVCKNLGIQIYGDGVSQMTLYKSNLLVSW